MSVRRRMKDLSTAELAVLGREYLLAGHLIDRAGMPHLLGAHGQDAMRDVAIDEWMGASPVYSRRIQRLLGFVGTDVATIFKGMQFDIGAPHQFMDFRYRVTDADHGEFWLAHCGALMDVEPMGESLIITMCHHIEDPTFDATAYATNPRAQVRPIHRPPRVPSDRHPHCHWTVEVVPDAEPLAEPEAAVRVARTLAAAVPLPVIVADLRAGSGSAASSGFDDYTRPLDPDLRLDDFSRSALLAIADEVCLQGHLLVMSFLDAVALRFGADAALTIGRKQFTGSAGVAAGRLAKAFGLEPGSVAHLATLFDLHPAFHPRSYVDIEIETGSETETETETDADRLVVALRDCPAIREPSGFVWPSMLTGDGALGSLDAIAQALDPTARCTPIVPLAGARLAWEITLGHEPADEPADVTLTKFSTGADFVFA